MDIIEDTAITAVVLTHNSQRVLSQCLQSLQFCSSLLIIDAGSTDDTLSIAEHYGAKVIYRQWDTYQNQYSFALSQVQTPWTLVLDSDEICSQELQESIIQEVNSADRTYDAFLLSRCTWYLDRFLLHGSWYPEYIARLFRTGSVVMQVNNGGHIEFVSSSPLKKLQGDIMHYSYSSYFHELTKLNVYAENGARMLRNKGKKGGIVQAILHSMSRFIMQYIVRLGFLDGRAGFILSVHEAFYVFCKYVRVIEDTWGAPYTYTKHDITMPLHEKD